MAYATATLTSTSDFVKLSPNGRGVVTFFSLSGFTGTLAVQRSVDGTNYRTLSTYTAAPTEVIQVDVTSGVVRVIPTAISGGSATVELSDA